MKRLRLARMELPTAVAMLDVDPAVSISRIRSSGEKMQVHETEAKLSRLREGYLMVCDVVRDEFGLAVRILNGNAPLDEVTASAISFAREHKDVGTEH